MVDIEQRLKRAELKDKTGKIKLDAEKVKVEKLNSLRYLLVSETPLDGQYGEGTKYTASFDESERQTIKDKIFDIIATL
jgi:hypothetical protein